MSDDKNISLSQQEYINLMAHKITHDVVTETRVDIDRLRNDVDAKFSELKTSINQRFEQVDKRVDRMQVFLYWVVGIGVTSIIVPIALPLIKTHL
ncbi:hypothetical protein EDC55_10847 [Allofrancisella inopinata]|uniref:Uncharacterized protein n=1 Tax=Allofrancisella inopinata TaxID=1085647 RepID=A0AAE6YJ48_9GAMM|nr:hypothetical protein [Allofrancisella inopinata]QIV95697.1 hypothetical protein E4K63_02160 [Allofrancisella inopinata]TDT72154.1 hypothetical protein EDC55_10847 [Allofrancisella inopinata]